MNDAGASDVPGQRPPGALSIARSALSAHDPILLSCPRFCQRRSNLFVKLRHQVCEGMRPVWPAEVANREIQFPSARSSALLTPKCQPGEALC